MLAQCSADLLLVGADGAGDPQDLDRLRTPKVAVIWRRLGISRPRGSASKAPSMQAGSACVPLDRNRIFLVDLSRIHGWVHDSASDA